MLSRKRLLQGRAATEAKKKHCKAAEVIPQGQLKPLTESPKSSCVAQEYVGGHDREESAIKAPMSVNDDHESAEPGLDLSSAHRLLIFYDCETTGLSVYDDHITDLGAKVVDSPVPLQSPIFSSLVATSRPIPPRVTSLTGISTNTLLGEKPLSVVLPLFLDWVTDVTNHVSKVTTIPHYPVLVAHNGFSFDFPILLAETERLQQTLRVSIFESKNIHFSDTLPLLRQMKKNGGKSELSGCKLSLEMLHQHILGTAIEDSHRALPDVQAMEDIMTHPTLVNCLTNLSVRSLKEQVDLWLAQKDVHRQSADLLKALGHGTITKDQAKKLGELSLGFAELKALGANSPTPEAFMVALEAKGVNSMLLRKKLSVKLIRDYSLENFKEGENRMHRKHPHTIVLPQEILKHTQAASGST